MMYKILFAFGICGLLYSCTGNHSNERKHSNVIDTSSKTTIQSDQSGSAKNDVQQLLQGKWQHEEDTSNYLVFEGNKRKEIAGGNTEWDEEEFVLSNKCLNESDKDKGEEPEAFAYITCAKSDLCWYILGVDEKILSLQYMARGNTLTYKRVK